MEHADKFNSGLLGVGAGVVALALLSYSNLHIALNILFSVLIFLGVYGLFLRLQKTEVGFWIISPLIALAWAAAAGSLTYAFTQDNVWRWVIFGVIFVINMGLLIKAKDN